MLCTVQQANDRYNNLNAANRAKVDAAHDAGMGSIAAPLSEHESILNAENGFAFLRALWLYHAPNGLVARLVAIMNADRCTQEENESEENFQNRRRVQRAGVGPTTQEERDLVQRMLTMTQPKLLQMVEDMGNAPAAAHVDAV